MITGAMHYCKKKRVARLKKTQVVKIKVTERVKTATR